MPKQLRKTTLKIVPLLTFACAAALLVISCSTPMGNPEDGKRWYLMHNCFSCHGPHGNDGKAPEISNLSMGFWRFKRKIRNAGSPIMPKYPAAKISDQDVADIYAMLKAR